MLDTGFPQADVENDFLRARRHQVLARLAHRLRYQPGDSDRLLPLDEVTGALGMRGERYMGLQTIRLDTIVGTVDSRREFDRHFRPTSNRVRERWEQLALAERRGAAIPPIEVPADHRRLRDRDTHHRAAQPHNAPRRPDAPAKTPNGPSAGSAPAGSPPDGLTETRGKMAHAAAARAIEDRSIPLKSGPPAAPNILTGTPPTVVCPSPWPAQNRQGG